jgi:hypothetical protein
MFSFSKFRNGFGAYPASTWFISVRVKGPGLEHDHLLLLQRLRICGAVPPRRICLYGLRGTALALFTISGRLCVFGIYKKLVTVSFKQNFYFAKKTGNAVCEVCPSEQAAKDKSLLIVFHCSVVTLLLPLSSHCGTITVSAHRWVKTNEHLAPYVSYKAVTIATPCLVLPPGSAFQW